MRLRKLDKDLKQDIPCDECGEKSIFEIIFEKLDDSLHFYLCKGCLKEFCNLGTRMIDFLEEYK